MTEPSSTSVAPGKQIDDNTGKDTLRFITCGSVDDGKSTLIGRLLFESMAIFDDQLDALDRDSLKFGTQDGEIDLALLLDGLVAEREQGITIDVAYRYFSTGKRRYIVADTPGHEQYTRNMATAASTASVAIIMVDACKGVRTQTRRHAFIASLLGIRKVVLAVNKMDMVDYSQDEFRSIVESFSTLNPTLEFEEIVAIPLSALKGDNVVRRSPSMVWYQGTTLLEYLENVSNDQDVTGPLRMSVQYVIRAQQNFRGYAGRISSGTLGVGQTITILPSGVSAQVESIIIGNDAVQNAMAGQSITVTLSGEYDVSRGDIFAEAATELKVSDQYRAKIIWMDQTEMIPGRRYIFRTETVSLYASVAKPRYRINVNNYERLPATTLALNDIGSANIFLDRKIALDSYAENRTNGSFVLLDSETNATSGVGMINFNLRRSQNIHWQDLELAGEQRAAVKNQKPFVLWLTGLSGSGKSTIASIIEKKLYDMQRHTMILDGDNVRHGLSRDLGFTEVDRVENIRRVAEVAKLMSDAGIITLVSLISPFASERQLAREIVGDGKFVEIFVDTPLEEAERRDVKGLYRKARRGELKNFTGIDSTYEPPLKPEIVLGTLDTQPDAAADAVIEWLKSNDYF